MGAGFEMLLSGTPLGVLLGLGLIAAIGFFVYLALRGDKPDKPKQRGRRGSTTGV